MQKVIEAIEGLYQRAHDNVKAMVWEGDRISAVVTGDRIGFEAT